MLKLGKGRSKLAVAGIARHRFQELVVWHQLLTAQRDLFRVETHEALKVLPAKPPELPWLATLMPPFTIQEGSETREQIETLLWAIAMSVSRKTARDALVSARQFHRPSFRRLKLVSSMRQCITHRTRFGICITKFIQHR